MDLVSLELINFGSYINQVIDFSGLHIVCLYGDNGSGKTTFTEAISWALFGKGPKSGRRNDSDCYVNDKATECSVTLVFELNKILYKIYRSWNKKDRKGQLNFFYKEDDWIPIGSGKRDVQNEIVKTLGMDYKTFIASVFAPQGQSDSLTSDNLDDMEKKEIISTILGLGFWDDFLKKAQEESKNKQRELEVLANKMEPLKACVDNEEAVQLSLKEKEECLVEKEGLFEEVLHDVSDLEKYFYFSNKEKETMDQLLKSKQEETSKFNKAKEEIITEKESLFKNIEYLEKKIADTTKKLKEHQEIIAQKEEIEERYGEYESVSSELASFDEKLVKYNQICKEIADKEKEETKWVIKQKEILSELRTQIEKDQKTASLLDRVNCDHEMKENCPLLKNAHEAKKSLTEAEEQYELMQTFKSPYGDKIANLKKKLEEVGYNEREHNLKKSELQKLQCYASLKIELGSALAEHKHLTKNIEENQNQIKENKDKIGSLDDRLRTLTEDYQKQMAVIDEDIKKIEESLAKYDENKEALNIKREQLDILKEEVNVLREEIGALRQQCTEIKKAKEDLTKCNKAYTKLDEEIKILKILEKAAHKKSGVPLFIIENTRPQIESLTNDLLERITDGRFSISIETQVETKTTENIREVLKVIVYDSGLPRPYHQLSGAEKFIIDISIRVGICKFLAYRSGTAIKLLIIDEGLSSLDEKNRPRILKALLEIGKEFNKVLVITHIADFYNMLSQRMCFKNDQGTEVTIFK